MEYEEAITRISNAYYILAGVMIEDKNYSKSLAICVRELKKIINEETKKINKFD